MANADSVLGENSLPTDFLSGPAPEPTATRIDFANSPLPENDDLYAVVLDGVLSIGECQALVAAAEASTTNGWERALINIGNGKQAMYEDVRNCGRIIWDDPHLVAKLWARCEPLLPELQELHRWNKVTGQARNKNWKLTRLNERMRFLKYTSGEYFRPHYDAMYETPDKSERTYFTLHLYLNGTEGEAQPLEGGATTFWSIDLDRRLDVQPKAGSILIFQQRNLLHSGDDVVKGTKLTMRTELMYKAEAADDETELENVQRKRRKTGRR